MLSVGFDQGDSKVREKESAEPAGGDTAAANKTGSGGGFQASVFADL